MHLGLIKLIEEYQAIVAEAVTLLEASEFPTPTSNQEWANTISPYRETLLGGIGYYKHGFGCAVYLRPYPVDFDFGDEGQINGFDPYRPALFASERLNTFGFQSEAELNESFEIAIQEGKIVHSKEENFYLSHREQ